MRSIEENYQCITDDETIDIAKLKEAEQLDSLDEE